MDQAQARFTGEPDDFFIVDEDSGLSNDFFSKFNPDQLRNEKGEWATGGGGGSQYKSYDDKDSKYTALAARSLHSKQEKLTPEQLKEVRRYTGSGADTINLYLRRGGKFQDWQLVTEQDHAAMNARIKAMDGAIGGAKLPEHIETYRGISDRGWDRLLKKNLRAGSVVKDPGFVSSSMRTQTAHMFSEGLGEGAGIKYKLPAGAKAYVTNGVSSHEHETEVIINRNSSFKVRGIDRKKRIITMEWMK